jgi:hypothetical protein
MHHLPDSGRTALRPEVLGCYALLNIDYEDRPQPILQMPPRVRFRRDVVVAPAIRRLDALDARGAPFHPAVGELGMGIAAWFADSSSNRVLFELGDGLLGWVFSVQMPPHRVDTIRGLGRRYSDRPQWDAGPPAHTIMLARLACDP